MVDLSHSVFQDQMNSVNETLNDNDRFATILCFNKIDRIPKDELKSLKEFWENKEFYVVFIFATKN